MPDSESGPWESHPCRVLRQLRREVSLTPVPVVAVADCRSACPGWVESLASEEGPGAPQVWLGYYPGTGNVSDECI